MPLIIDSHCDLAWNMRTYGRDYTLPAEETRRREKGTATVDRNGETLIGWPDYQRGQVAAVFGTLFAAPIRRSEGGWDKLCYSNPDEAHKLYVDQLHLYHELTERRPECFRLIQSARDLKEHMASWEKSEEAARRVGIVVLMEGAEGIRNADELAEWHELGLRLIGLAWTGTRYCGGTREPGPLTPEGHQLLKAMADLNMVLDLSHMDERAAIEALDVYEGPVIASHVNCLALLPGFPTNRHFSDEVLRKLVRRGGIIGNMPVNAFLKTGWVLKDSSRREEVPLEVFAAHLDHVCQLAGDALHSGIGSDFDGGFGLASVPPEIDTVADLQKLAPLLKRRGYSDQDVASIMGLNWLHFLETNLPQ